MEDQRHVRAGKASTAHPARPTYRYRTEDLYRTCPNVQVIGGAFPKPRPPLCLQHILLCQSALVCPLFTYMLLMARLCVLLHVPGEVIGLRLCTCVSVMLLLREVENNRRCSQFWTLLSPLSGQGYSQGSDLQRGQFLLLWWIGPTLFVFSWRLVMG